MIKIVRIKMKGFRSFVEETTVNFPGRGLLLLQGRNGSGKSTIGLAIAYALGYCPFPATALQSWLSEKDMQVSLELCTPDGKIFIYRGVKNVVEFHPWEGSNVITKGSIAAVEKEIRKLIGLDSEILGELCYRPQQTRGTFLSKTDKEKKEFLTGLLGLDKFEKAYDKHKEEYRKYDTVVRNYEQDWIEAKRELGEYGPPPCTLDETYEQTTLVVESNIRAKSVEQERIEGILGSLRNDFQDLLKQVSERRQAIDAEVKAYSNTVTFEPYDDSETKELEKLMKKVQKKLDTLQATDAQRMAVYFKKRDEDYQERNRILATIASIDTELATKRPKLVNDLETLTDNKCPTCEQDWVKAKDLVLQAQIMIDTIDRRARDLPALTKAVEECNQVILSYDDPFEPDPQIEEYRKALQETTYKFYEAQNRQRAHEDAQHAGYRLAVDAYRAKLESELADLQGQIGKLQTENALHNEALNKNLKERMELESELAVLKRTRESQELSISLWTGMKQKLEGDVALLEAKIKELADCRNMESDFIELIGREGFLGAIFDEVLDEISNETNRVLAALPNTADVFLKFESEVVTGKGTVSREIKPVVTIRGFAAPLRAGTSGGMYLSIEQAVDIAVNRVVSRRTGIVPGWIVLDECFGDQDLPTKEETMAVLRELGKDRLVIVVDHATEFKEAFTQFIDLEFHNGVSSVTV